MLPRTLFFGFLFTSASGYHKPEWEHPHRFKKDLVNSKDMVDNTEVLLFYQKLSTFLFDKSHFMEHGNDHYLTRNIKIVATADQLEQLSANKNIRKLDGIVFSILEQSQVGVVEETTNKIVHYFATILNHIIRSNQLIFLALTALSIGIIWVISRALKRNVLLIAILYLFTIGFILRYMDCNKRLEVEDYFKMKTNFGKDPCEMKQPNNFMESIMLYFTNSKKECLDHLQSMRQTNNYICNPIDIFNEITFSFVFKYLILSVENAGKLFDGIKFPYNIMLGFFLLILAREFIINLIKETFKISFKLFTTPSSRRLFVQRDVKAESLPQVADRLTGDNLTKIISALEQAALKQEKQAAPILITIKKTSKTDASQSAPASIEDRKTPTESEKSSSKVEVLPNKDATNEESDSDGDSIEVIENESDF